MVIPGLLVLPEKFLFPLGQGDGLEKYIEGPGNGDKVDHDDYQADGQVARFMPKLDRGTIADWLSGIFWGP